MPSYYSENLAAERLELCYELAPPSVKSYLAAEIEHVCQRAHSSERVLELGCGYGRVLRELMHTGASVVGIDTSLQSLSMAQAYLDGEDHASLILMDAVRLGFPSGVFDVVCCIQNGISAFHVDQRELLSEAVRVSKPGGRVLFSSYAVEFWKDRYLCFWRYG